jgi:hypothetical protein
MQSIEASGFLRPLRRMRLSHAWLIVLVVIGCDQNLPIGRVQTAPDLASASDGGQPNPTCPGDPQCVGQDAGTVVDQGGGVADLGGRQAQTGIACGTQTCAADQVCVSSMAGPNSSLSCEPLGACASDPTCNCFIMTPNTLLRCYFNSQCNVDSVGVVHCDL